MRFVYISDCTHIHLQQRVEQLFLCNLLLEIFLYTGYFIYLDHLKYLTYFLRWEEISEEENIRFEGTKVIGKKIFFKVTIYQGY